MFNWEITQDFRSYLAQFLRDCYGHSVAVYVVNAEQNVTERVLETRRFSVENG